MQTFTVTAANAARLDAFLLAQCPGVAPGRLHKYLRENKIKVNRKKTPLSTPLCVGDVVQIYFDAVLSAPAADSPLFLSARAVFSPVYETDEILIADKPAGVAVCDETETQADTFLNRALLYLYQKKEYVPGSTFTPCLCHRLDTGTSGLVMFAKTAEAETVITQLIRDHMICKKYVCVTFGHPPAKTDTLTGYLHKDAQRGFVSIDTKRTPDAKPVTTHYEVLAKSGPLALLSVELITGRTHQIRAHLASIGCPILGDSKYGDNAANRKYKLKYQALCAYSLSFPTIASGACKSLSGLQITAPKPWYFPQMLDGTLR